MHERPAFEALLHRFLPQIPVHEHWTTGIWTTNIDGRQAHEVGRMEVPGAVEKKYYMDVRWMPGGKSLSFVGKDGGVYVVPVD
jgi:hypothetical protein